MYSSRIRKSPARAAGIRHSADDRGRLAGKAGLCLAVEQERAIDFAHPINQGVTGDRVVKDRRGLRVREITFCNPCDGQVYVYLTSEMTLEPGLLVLLYKTRWEIEKVFDKTKTKLQEQNSWATTPAAKQMQSHFVALVHNLLLLVQDLHQQQGVENSAEIQRKHKRLKQQEAQLAKTHRTLPLIYKTLQRFTQAASNSSAGSALTGITPPPSR